MRPPDPHLGMDGWVLCRLYHDLLVPRALPDIGRPTDLGSACNFDEVGRALFSVMVDARFICPMVEEPISSLSLFERGGKGP